MDFTVLRGDLVKTLSTIRTKGIMILADGIRIIKSLSQQLIIVQSQEFNPRTSLPIMLD